MVGYMQMQLIEKNVEFFDIDEKLAVCGDWCCGGRVEGAFLSAYNLAKIFKEQYF